MSVFMSAFTQGALGGIGAMLVRGLHSGSQCITGGLKLGLRERPFDSSWDLGALRVGVNSFVGRMGQRAVGIVATSCIGVVAVLRTSARSVGTQLW